MGIARTRTRFPGDSTTCRAFGRSTIRSTEVYSLSATRPSCDVNVKYSVETFCLSFFFFFLRRLKINRAVVHFFLKGIEKVIKSQLKYSGQHFLVVLFFRYFFFLTLRSATIAALLTSLSVTRERRIDALHTLPFSISYRNANRFVTELRVNKSGMNLRRTEGERKVGGGIWG
ncbi:hypothetical protein PUN28_003101 [Cardiocondyla obscurior]|uniref:Uncharacterized protein n=1 Tax=Cardiocondyla obscurior TaxID=286306 RepID=A0AAW2GIT4_9HYME